MMVFRGSLVKTKVIVQANGSVELGEPEFLLDDLPLALVPESRGVPSEKL